MRTKFRFFKFAAKVTSRIGPSVPVLLTTRLTDPITMSGGAKDVAPPAEMIGEPIRTAPNLG